MFVSKGFQYSDILIKWYLNILYLYTELESLVSTVPKSANLIYEVSAKQKNSSRIEALS